MEDIFNPDSYSDAILEKIKEGKSNIVVNAVAGAGKTTTILKAVEVVPKDKDVLFVSFNKSINDEICNKLKEKEWDKLDNLEKVKFGSKDKIDLPFYLTVSTCHSLGLKLLQDYLGKKVNLEEWKYEARFNEIRSSESYIELNHNEELAYTSNVKRLIQYARFFLCDTTFAIEKVAERYGLNLIDNESDVVLDLMKWGKEHTDTVDYTDMIWLPHAFNIKATKKYDVVFIDEAQDLSKMQQELIKRVQKKHSIFVAVGDINQCINAWDGADPDAFKNFLSNDNTIPMDMPVTRRCAKAIVRLAQQFVPQIQALPDAVEGEVIYNANPWDPKDAHDCVLCRNNAPLTKFLNYCLERNIKVRLAGADDFRKKLMELLDTTNEEMLGLTFNEYGVFPDLYKNLIHNINYLRNTKHIDERSAYKANTTTLDYIKCLETLATGLSTKTELIDKINAITADRSNSGIMLSTIHKSKGLTFDNCYILGKSLIPSPLAEKDWELQAEDNLLYVAITRARYKLAYISEEKFPVDNIFSNPEKSRKFLRDIEKQLDILDKVPRGKKANINRDISGKTTNTRTRKVGALKFKGIMK